MSIFATVTLVLVIVGSVLFILVKILQKYVEQLVAFVADNSTVAVAPPPCVNRADRGTMKEYERTNFFFRSASCLGFHCSEKGRITFKGKSCGEVRVLENGVITIYLDDATAGILFDNIYATLGGMGNDLKPILGELGIQIYALARH
jgi:hypothetical protein